MAKGVVLFNNIAVLMRNHEQLHRKLVTKGQRRFVIFMPSDQEARASLLNYLSTAQLKIYWYPEMLPTISDIKTLASTWPKLGVLSRDMDDFERGMVETLLVYYHQPAFKQLLKNGSHSLQ